MYLVRSALAGVLFVIWTLLCACAVILAGLSSQRQAHQDQVIWCWAKVSLFLFNVSVFLKGQENLLPTPKGCLFLFNHTSHFDILIFTSAVRKSHRYGAKIELFSIPMFGAAMRAAGMLPIVRANRNKVLRLYDESISRVMQGESFVLAAEGTRMHAPGVGEKFKTGPFQFAINGQFPIVPVLLRGAYECMPKGSVLPCTNRWQHQASVQILPAVETTGYTLETLETLQKHVQNIMTKAYAQG